MPRLIVINLYFSLHFQMAFNECILFNECIGWYNINYIVRLMIQSKKDLAQRDRKTVFSREIVTKNPIFTKEHCQDFFEMFSLYCDNRRQCDVADILNTAKTLGFDKKYKIIFDALTAVNADLAG